MKLPEFFSFEPLNRLKERMGIPRDVYGSLTVKVEPGRLTEHELNQLSAGDGIDDPVRRHWSDLSASGTGFPAIAGKSRLLSECSAPTGWRAR